MAITKQEYILRSLSKIAHKKWELFVISRILHGLSDDEIEFVTQQLVRRPDGTRALTDIYFPQFNLHVEIDEPDHENHLQDDELREQDIILQTGHEVKHIKIAVENSVPAKEKDISLVRRDVDELIEYIAEQKKIAIRSNKFSPWNWEERYSSVPVIKRGNVSIQDNVVFHTQIEAMRCFGFRGNGWQRGAWKIPDGTGDVIWFPRLYPHGMWNNELAEGGKKIFERAANEDGVSSIKQQIEEGAQRPHVKWIVFAKAKDHLGFNLYRYVGSFKMNIDESTEDNLVFDRVSSVEAVRNLNLPEKSTSYLA